MALRVTRRDAIGVVTRSRDRNKLGPPIFIADKGALEQPDWAMADLGHPNPLRYENVSEASWDCSVAKVRHLRRRARRRSESNDQRSMSISVL